MPEPNGIPPEQNPQPPQEIIDLLKQLARAEIQGALDTFRIYLAAEFVPQINANVPKEDSIVQKVTGLVQGKIVEEAGELRGRLEAIERKVAASTVAPTTALGPSSSSFSFEQLPTIIGVGLDAIVKVMQARAAMSNPIMQAQNWVDTQPLMARWIGQMLNPDPLAPKLPGLMTSSAAAGLRAGVDATKSLLKQEGGQQAWSGGSNPQSDSPAWYGGSSPMPIEQPQRPSGGNAQPSAATPTGYVNMQSRSNGYRAQYAAQNSGAVVRVSRMGSGQAAEQRGKPVKLSEQLRGL